jgi:Fe-S oxidoreductase
MAKIKAEFEHQYHKKHGIPLQTKLIGNFASIMHLLRPVAPVFNAVNRSRFGKALLKKVVGFSPRRDLPKIQPAGLKAYCEKHKLESEINPDILLFVDEFTDLTDTSIGIAAVTLLYKLGITFQLVSPAESGRSYLSKGMLTKAQSCAFKNVTALADVVNQNRPLVGIEPSAILTFRDEYVDLLTGEAKKQAEALAQNSFTIEEFLSQLIDKNALRSDRFHDESREILIHGHCHQKALSSEAHTRKILSLPQNYSARLIPSGCCGMAGSFGYMEKHYALSMQIGETTLFPAVRKAKPGQLIAASGTSCRHQIADGTSVEALHPVEILLRAVK